MGNAESSTRGSKDARDILAPEASRQALEVLPAASGSGHEQKTVARLRPRRPVQVTAKCTVREAAERMQGARADSCVVVADGGGLLGILTDTDLCKRVLAKDLNPDTVTVSAVMTAAPACAQMDSSATDALSLMLGRRFRHLPVLRGGSSDSAVSGVLDIAKCLSDAVDKIESQLGRGGTAPAEVVQVHQRVQHAMLRGKRNTAEEQAAAMQELVADLSAMVNTGASMPTLRDVCESEGASVADCCLDASTSVRAAAKCMAETGLAVLVTREKAFVGILTPRELLNRVLAEHEINPDTTPISLVMTSECEAANPEATIVETLWQMHDGACLSVPVVESTGAILGVVDVFTLMYGLGGSSGAGADGWRSVFAAAIEDVDAAASEVSSHAGSKRGSADFESKSVARLRPRKAITVSARSLVREAAQQMRDAKRDSVVVVGTSGTLRGIVTDKDLVRKVLAANLDPNTVEVATIMTKDPSTVRSDSNAMEALTTMVDNNFRHLPVRSALGTLVGVLDIARCLNDAVERLELACDEVSPADAPDHAMLNEVVSGIKAHAMQRHSNSNASPELVDKFLGALVEKLFDGGNNPIPTLRKVCQLAGVSPTSCCLDASQTVRAAAVCMAQNRQAVLAMRGDSLVGIVTPKDLVNRILAVDGLDPDVADISSVMTPGVETADPDMTIVEALWQMHDGRYLHLPVVESNGTVLGVVDVLTVLRSIPDSGRRRLFTGAGPCGDDFSVGRLITQQPPEQVTYKVSYRGEVYVLKASALHFDLLAMACARMFDVDPLRVVFLFVDEEGDELTLADDASLVHAVGASGADSVKITLVVKGALASDAPSALEPRNVTAPVVAPAPDAGACVEVEVDVASRGPRRSLVLLGALALVFGAAAAAARSPEARAKVEAAVEKAVSSLPLGACLLSRLRALREA